MSEEQGKEDLTTEGGKEEAPPAPETAVEDRGGGEEQPSGGGEEEVKEELEGGGGREEEQGQAVELKEDASEGKEGGETGEGEVKEKGGEAEGEAKDDEEGGKGEVEEGETEDGVGEGGGETAGEERQEGGPGEASEEKEGERKEEAVEGEPKESEGAEGERVEDESAKTKGVDGDGAEGEGGEGEGGEGVDDGATAVEKAEVSGSERQSPEERSEATPTGTPQTDSQEVGRVGVVTTPPDSRLQSGSRMALQPPPLGNITEEEEEEELMEEEEEEEVDRDELIQSCREALLRQKKLRSENLQLQHKIAEYLSRRKVEEKPDPGRNVTDQEKRYLQCMGALEQLKGELARLQEDWVLQEQGMRGLCEEKQQRVQEEMEEFLRYQKEGALLAVDSRSGRRLSSAEIGKKQAEQERRDQAVYQARLENIKLTNKTDKQEMLLKQKEELAEGMHMIDFEQLKISNVDLTEKIEGRNEDITKLTGKVRATVEVLTHVKEKLHFLQDENTRKKEYLSELDVELSKSRDLLTRLKQARDSLRLDNQRLRQRGGLVSHSALLRDFEERKDQNEELQERLEYLQQHHSQLSLQCRGLRRKTEQARALHHT